ncbi:uncharacterized protein si:ch211-191i18.4 [Thunnus albacares]|uniref:uncharacterized protein si:ch211-191i18.4 n=1 Tax=Thunnus albacares TaxID=8236 RepID=UPI001CF68D73|nr:uncharacterized protein si:ch211-191i18.4 [Thunnus albacares]XP_044192148.1 uncharacterized protein si:ch211-191i18.4 [Thunnus albacares]XP_044192149.1 uncharacterized protein si:ch211-191i18.4 [Thunnus albacares]XP_044192150.1 uncharacterized protein si:ch211-191i18.4 [Thunnus albacares]
MKLCAVFLLLICCVCLQTVKCSLPTPPPQVEAAVNSESNVVTSLKNDGFRRLPGLCRRLKRRRVTVLCNLEKYCWWGRTWGRSQSGQVCRCPRGSRCSHFFLRSL